ncbi:MAG TPA: hypothetical protein VGR78_14870 [Verrucomicrobiae bacterium]|jgi:hypothetical protein|nr:hypothetical protein [Verrucomicrobiae bacterium]
MLARAHPEIAQKITSAIAREGVQESGKIELLFGEAKQPFPFRHYELKEVRRAGDKIIRTEVVTDKPMEGWEQYADLRLLASMAEKDPIAARENWGAAMKMWDGRGFLDEATPHNHLYATYKLALAVIAANHLSPSPKLPSGLLDKLLELQSDSGGWITDYDPWTRGRTRQCRNHLPRIARDRTKRSLI